jgi:putative alpha-1,2-mannosidase
MKIVLFPGKNHLYYTLNNLKYIFSACLAGLYLFANAQAEKVNVFLGSSGDRGQMSPGASYPFSMMDICPQTYPNGHTGYEHKAKTFLGFTHNRFEGVGCEGSGGNILITPYDQKNSALIKKKEWASPGNYNVSFTSGISAAFYVLGKSGIEKYHFKNKQNGFLIDLSHTLANSFVAEEHQADASSLSGWIESGTTCNAGIYRVYYYILFEQPMFISKNENHVLKVSTENEDVILRIAFSSFSVDCAKAAITKKSFEQVKNDATRDWNKVLSQIRVSGDPNEERLFYSLLYRVLQSPYVVSEPGQKKLYNGWSVWDNYKTQLPLLSIVYPDEYKAILHSLAGLYLHGKKNWATDHEPSNTVRTEHSIVVLLDAYRKGYDIDINTILDSLLKETDSLKYNHPDKALESCYDAWAMSEILHILHRDSLSIVYKQKALNWRNYWRKDFMDLSREDIDDLPARGMYQGTILQYRWFAPFDVKGLIEECGGEETYIHQLDSFFSNDYYNAANEPDIQVPYMYSGTTMPWKSQDIIHKYARDTVIQYYYNDNSRGIDPFIGRIYNNRPEAYVRTMDDDAGAMSGWYVLAAIGLSPACVGWPVWYLHVPLFKTVSFHHFNISVLNFSREAKYIQSVTLNGKTLGRNWLTQEEIMKGGKLIITASNKPNKQFGIKNRFLP